MIFQIETLKWKYSSAFFVVNYVLWLYTGLIKWVFGFRPLIPQPNIQEGLPLPHVRRRVEGVFLVTAKNCLQTNLTLTIWDWIMSET